MLRQCPLSHGSADAGLYVVWLVCLVKQGHSLMEGRHHACEASAAYLASVARNSDALLTPSTAFVALCLAYLAAPGDQRSCNYHPQSGHPEPIVLLQC